MAKTVNVNNVKTMIKGYLNLVIIQVLAALVLFIFPNLLGSFFMITVGIVFIIVGIAMILALLSRPKEFVSAFSYVLPIIIIGIGIYVMLQPRDVITFVALVIGIGTVCKGLANLFFVDVPMEKRNTRTLGIISIIIGVIIIILSVNGSINTTFSIYVGIDLMFHAIVDCLIMLNLKKVVKSVGNDEVVTIDIIN